MIGLYTFNGFQHLGQPVLHIFGMQPRPFPDLYQYRQKVGAFLRKIVHHFLFMSGVFFFPDDLFFFQHR